ncbi:MAG: exodeoxyribonuclease V subunit alpha [Deltaproteobacteria bacterium]|jgi:exodeoxyribonuclease V alpha subunit|nr:exodeoxyribonuclease V subunit alpha [Deltaproteobacteria bacterium]
MISPIDFHFGQFIMQFSKKYDPDIFLAAALASRATQHGDICLDLSKCAESAVFENGRHHKTFVAPELTGWLKKLKAFPAIGNPGQKRPLILDDHHRLYLFRYWEYETKLAGMIRQRVYDQSIDPHGPRLKKCLKKHFPAEKDHAVDWQKIAAITAVLNKISIITGGPGTGKTFTITKILVLLMEMADGGGLKTCLAAPTGKAAARLQESIRQSIQLMKCSERIKSEIATEVKTIHRLLNPRAGSPYFHYNGENPLAADIVIIDEASMVDLALMSKLVQAVPMSARLVLIGDKDQLASVEAGSVLGDICDRNILHGFSKEYKAKVLALTDEDLDVNQKPSSQKAGLQDCIVVLSKSYRFSGDSDIGPLSRFVNQGDSENTLNLLRHSENRTIAWYDMDSEEAVFKALEDKIVEGYRSYLASQDPVSALKEFSRFKILCALRIGPLGVASINRLAEEILQRHGLMQPDPGGANSFEPGGSNSWYKGRPVLITRNDYNLGLFNGDIGVTWPDPAGSPQDLLVFFPAANDQVKSYAIHRLPEHETVFAMTVHKSQGSEFDEIILLVPPKNYSVLTRELIYTGLTRAKHKFSLWAKSSVLENAIKQKIERTSGLRESLWQ